MSRALVSNGPQRRGVRAHRIEHPVDGPADFRPVAAPG
jgi:hypothetical protein